MSFSVGAKGRQNNMVGQELGRGLAKIDGTGYESMNSFNRKIQESHFSYFVRLCCHNCDISVVFEKSA